MNTQMTVTLGGSNRNSSSKPWQQGAAWSLVHLPELTLDHGTECCHNREKGVHCGSSPRSLAFPQTEDQLVSVTSMAFAIRLCSPPGHRARNTIVTSWAYAFKTLVIL